MDERRYTNKFNFGDTFYYPVFAPEGYFQFIKGPLELKSIHCIKHYRPHPEIYEPPRYEEFVYEFETGEQLKENEIYTSKKAAEKAVLLISQLRMDSIQRSVEELLKK